MRALDLNGLLWRIYRCQTDPTENHCNTKCISKLFMSWSTAVAWCFPELKYQCRRMVNRINSKHFNGIIKVHEIRNNDLAHVSEEWISWQFMRSVVNLFWLCKNFLFQSALGRSPSSSVLLPFASHNLGLTAVRPLGNCWNSRKQLYLRIGVITKLIYPLCKSFKTFA